MKKCKPGETLRNDPTESVCVDVEQRNIGQQAQLDWKIPSDITVVDINTSNNFQCWVIKSRSTENSIVGTNIGTDPISRYVKRVRVDSDLPRLKCNVCALKPGIWKREAPQANFKLVVVRQISMTMESQQLATGNEGCLGIGKSCGEGREKGKRRDENEEEAA